MATRITPNLSDTEDVLAQILSHVLPNPDMRVSFLVPAGQGVPILARIRTMVSRKRKKIAQSGKKPRRFQLSSTLHPETHAGVRMECVIIWQKVSDLHMMTEVVEDLMANE